MKIGLFGGTFNPIHKGHLKVAKNILAKTDIEKILFLPSGKPPHKSARNLLPFPKRLKLLELTLAKYNKFEVSDLDFNEGNPSYTKLLIEKIKTLFPNDQVYFIIGEDNVYDLQNWFAFDWLLENVKFLVVTRSLESKPSDIAYGNQLEYVKMAPIDISSSEIRNRIKTKQNIENFVPKEILNTLEKWSHFF